MSPTTSFAAIPFVTDDAAIGSPNQLLIETFTENWRVPAKGGNASANLLGQYLGFSYGTTKNLEVTAGSLAAYDFSADSAAFMNPILQLKTLAFHSKKPEVPSIAISAAYVNKSGSGQYYDPATNAYLMAIATSKFFDDGLIIHVNSGPKASYDLPTRKNLYRLHLGIALDFALLRQDLRFFTESYNGSPNSPRDSSGYFHSYQTGFKFLQSDKLSFHILYGNQPTFMGYDDNNVMTYKRTSWVQFGVRRIIDDIF